MNARQAQEPSEIKAVTFDIPGDPVSANRMWRVGHGRNYESPEAVTWKQSVAWHAHIAIRKPFEGPVGVTILYCHRHPNRRLDLDNVAKPILDALIGTAYTDDRQVVRLALCAAQDADNPRIRITVEAER